MSELGRIIGPKASKGAALSSTLTVADVDGLHVRPTTGSTRASVTSQQAALWVNSGSQFTNSLFSPHEKGSAFYHDTDVPAQIPWKQYWSPWITLSALVPLLSVEDILDDPCLRHVPRNVINKISRTFKARCVFNLPPSIDDVPCQELESASQGFSFSGMFSWATEGLKNRLFVFGNATPPARNGKPSEPCTRTPQSQRIGPHGGPVIYANNHTGFLSSSPPPVRELPSVPPSVNVRRSPSSIKDVASAASLSSWAAANSIPFIYRDGEVFVPRHDDPSVEDHERRHELENMLHPLLPPATPEKATRESAAPVAVQWLESRHTSEFRSSRDDVVANNVAPVPVPVPAQPASVLAILPVQTPAPPPVQAPTPVVAGPSSPLTRQREDDEDSDAEEEERPRSRRRTQ
ncbi:hypothetical protein EV421DRAFT_1737283 [Armillaria borealis]|uniref:Uncharacterized protein n=1 Tax=Armillaria borealis TaxID=47425 RepID=A0AA39MNB1_9AGAR|nr:hypothetical protein EV421DRAFT_1737283 [Armillaria borealis]